MLKLKFIPVDFSICKIKDISEVNFEDGFLFLSKTDEEISLVCCSEQVPKNIVAVENNWNALRIEGELDFSMIGVLSKISTILAENQISIFAVSTFNTDYILLKSNKTDAAIQALKASGYQII